MDEVKYIFERQKKELNQSLRYASYIQKALLPSEKTISKYLPEHFILYLPRDIVSGDFYWISKKGNQLYLAVADCTGHGVPGAFLSILGISFLNHIVDRNNCITASSVLNSLREHIMKSLNQTGDEKEQKDGIDMGICIIDYNSNKLHYAGAFNPLYIVKKDNRIFELPGDKMPIGIAPEIEVPFNNHLVDLEKDDMVYLFSDGFVDQFGGTEGKKFKYRPFRNFLLSINKMPVELQKSSLIKTFENWKGDNPQLDDVLIFGFRYH
jgi:serine phosphatase RsbU (regulator of sigma subunit)